MQVNEPVPVRRAAIGCLLVAALGVGLGVLVRPAIFTLAPPRDDSAVIVATAAEVSGGPVRRDVILARSYGWAGERDAGDGRVQLSLIIGPSAFGGLAVVAGSSPVEERCPVEIGADRLVDCEGRAWTFEGAPLDPADPPLDRFPAEIDDGAVVVDFTGTPND